MKNTENKNSIISEAVADLKSISDIATKNAINRMKNELPKEFNSILKEELSKINNESVKESAKGKEKEPIIEGKKTDGDKESINEMEEIDLRELSIDDIEEAYNEASNSDEFEISDSDEIDIDDVEKELEEMEGMSNEMENMQNEDKNDPYDKLKDLHKMLGEMIQDKEQTNEMHKGTGKEEMSAMHNENLSPTTIDEAAIDPTLLGAIGGSLGVLAASGGLAALMDYLKKNNPKVAKSLEQLGSAASKGIKGGSTSMGEGEEMIDEAAGKVAIDFIIGLILTRKDPKREANASDQDIQKAMGEMKRLGLNPPAGNIGESEEIVDETAGSQKGHAINRTVGNENMPKSSPRKDSTQRQFQHEGVKSISNESIKKFVAQKEAMEKRMNSLISENKKLTKKFNENKGTIKSLTESHDKFKQTLVKYRDQLSEMAIFNTNLASVNSLLVNESLGLTNEDKKSIINKFKNVNSITESENTYKSVLAEMKSEKKKTLDESIEDKVSKTIDKSSSKKVVEQTAFVNEHIEKIKRNMKYVDNHGNSKKVI